ISPIANVNYEHAGNPNPIPVTATDNEGDPITLSASVASYSQVYNLRQQYLLRQFGGTYYFGEGGHAAKWLYGVPNQYNQPWYTLLPDGTLHAWDGSADSATGAVIATLSPNVYADPTLITNAQPPVDYATLFSVESQLQLFQQGNTYYTNDLGHGAKWLFSSTVLNQYGQPWYTLLPDGTLHAWDGIHDSAAGAVVATLDPTIYTNPSLLINAKAAPGLYPQLVAVEQQLDLSERGSYFTGLYGSDAKWLFSPILNQYKQPWYNLLPDGTIHAWNGSTDPATGSSAGAVVATVDASVYTDPTLLTNAQSPLAAKGVTAKIVSNTISISAPTNFVGSFQVTVTASDGLLNGQQNFVVTSTDTAPHISPIANQTVPGSAGSLMFTLAASDAEGDGISFSAQVVGYSQLAALRQLLQLQPFTSNYDFGALGGQAKWLQSTVLNQYGNGFYTLLPDGTLHAWGGSNDPMTGSSSGAVIANVGTAVYTDPTLLINAKTPAAPAIGMSVIGSELVLSQLMGFTGTFEVFVTASDGALSTRTSFLVTVT
ncbi:MAG: hypothetical protein ACRD36_00590, partial [Candidatus Acidiferrum sp.]